MRKRRNGFTSRPAVALETTSGSDSIENVSLDLDLILAELKADDWLANNVDLESIDEPKTSVATGIELQYVMESAWERDRVVQAHEEIAARGIQLVPLTVDALDASAALRSRYDALNVFDGVHLGRAVTLDEPIVSTGTLFPEITEIDHVDPRDLD